MLLSVQLFKFLDQMKIYNSKSKPPNTPFTPYWNYCIAEDHITLNYKSLSTLILKKEKEIIKTYSKPGETVQFFLNDGYTGVGGLTAHYSKTKSRFFTWKHPEIAKCKKAIKKIHREYYRQVVGKEAIFPVYIQCWANVLRKDKFMKPHVHEIDSDCYLGGNLMIQCKDTSTIFINPADTFNEREEYYSNNEVGKITIFPDYVPHYTTKHLSNTPRIGIAFDLALKKRNENYILLDDGK